MSIVVTSYFDIYIYIYIQGEFMWDILDRHGGMVGGVPVYSLLAYYMITL